MYSLLTFGAFLIFLALAPNWSELKVRASLKEWGETVMMRQVFELPPKDSDNILVSFDSLYGTCYAFLTVKASITLPRAIRLLLIFFASSKVWPVF